MTVTNNVSGATATTGSTSSSTATASNPYANLGADAYMKLLTTEMKNQDPTAPVDQTQMIAQMAQFSSLQGINDMDSTLKTMSGTLNAILTAQKAAATPAKPAGTTAAA